MAAYHEKFSGRVMILQLLEASNTSFRDLPFLIPCVDKSSGRNWLCYNHCLGICQHGKACIFKRKNGHVDGHQLPEDFVSALLQKLGPGIDYMC
jgi:hypothetical protein